MDQPRGRGAAAAARVRRGHEVDRERLGRVARAAGEQRPFHLTRSRLRLQMLICACCALLGRLWDHFFDYGVSLSYPFTNSDKLDYGRRALFCTCDLGSWTPSTYSKPQYTW